MARKAACALYDAFTAGEGGTVFARVGIDYHHHDLLYRTSGSSRYAEVVRRVSSALDPQGVIGRGKYGIVTGGGQERNKNQ